MGIFDSFKKGATKTKIQGEIVLLDREIAAIKKEFGVTLFDLLSKAVDGNTTPDLLKKQTEVANSFETFYKDVQDIIKEKEVKLKEIDTYEAKKDTRLPATTTQEKLSNFGMLVGEQTHATKCKADIAMMDRNIKLKKEAFGVEIFDKVVMEAEVLTGLKALTSSAVDKEIAGAIDAAKQKVSVPVNKKDMKNREIENLDHE